VDGFWKEICIPMKEQTENPHDPRPKGKPAGSWTLEEAWEFCKGQCGADPWCRACMKEKERLHEESLNRRAQADDKER